MKHSPLTIEEVYKYGRLLKDVKDDDELEGRVGELVNLILKRVDASVKWDAFAEPL